MISFVNHASQIAFVSTGDKRSEAFVDLVWRDNAAKLIGSAKSRDLRVGETASMYACVRGVSCVRVCAVSSRLTGTIDCASAPGLCGAFGTVRVPSVALYNVGDAGVRWHRGANTLHDLVRVCMSRVCSVSFGSARRWSLWRLDSKPRHHDSLDRATRCDQIVPVCALIVCFTQHTESGWSFARIETWAAAIVCGGE
jgi:hypothetical protein